MSLLEARAICLDVRNDLRILNNVSLTIKRGETLGIVGESGSGKTSLGRTLLRILEPSSGTLIFDGTDITHMPPAAMKLLRRRMQMIFQDPQSSLNPRHTIARILAAPLHLHGFDYSDTIISRLLDRVGLPHSAMTRYPHQLSGGQRQRVGIARAIALNPEFVVADEIVSGLDATTQAKILALLRTLKDEMGLALAFISHDLAVIRHICDRVIIMKAGEVVEEGETAKIFNSPASSFTKALISAIPPPTPDAGWLAREAPTAAG